MKTLLPPREPSRTSTPAELEELHITPETLQGFGKKQKFTLSVAVGFLALVLALAIVAGAWWKSRHSAALKAQTPPPAVTVQTQPEPAPACTQKTNRLQALTKSILRGPL